MMLQQGRSLNVLLDIQDIRLVNVVPLMEGIIATELFLMARMKLP